MVIIFTDEHQNKNEKKMEPNSHRKYQLWIWNDDSMKSLHLVVCMCAQCLCVYMISVRIWIQNVYMNHRHNCEKERIKHFSVRIYWLLQPKIIISINATVRNLCGALTKEFLHNSKHFIPFHFVKVLIFLPDASILHSSDDNISECFCDMTQFRYIFDEKKKHEGNTKNTHKIASISHIVHYYSIFVFILRLVFTNVKRSGNTYPTAIIQTVIGVTC